jgi:hypothetical protein
MKTNKRDYPSDNELWNWLKSEDHFESATYLVTGTLFNPDGFYSFQTQFWEAVLPHLAISLEIELTVSD